MKARNLNHQKVQEQNTEQGNGAEPKIHNESDKPEQIRYPKRVFLILSNEFCERFMFYGMKGILALYLKNKLGYTENDATVLYHGFVMMAYFMCIFGSILSDAWLGKFKTILYLSIVYALGSGVLTISAIPSVNISPKSGLIAGLLLIAVGSGGIKPCVAAFGGDQFKIPEQAKQVAIFFSVFYLSINCGAFLSTLITPILRDDVKCFGQSDCYSLAFGVPATLMLISIVLFMMGRSSYTYIKTSSENLLVQVTACISNAITMKISKRSARPKRKHLLDYSINKYGEQLVNDIRTLSKILILYLPLPLFWTVYDQKGSRWTFQAEKMNGDIGFYVIKPDQMQTIDPLLVILLIPLCEHAVYPKLIKIGLRRPLQRMIFGGFLAAIAFLMSSAVQFYIESSAIKSVHILWQLPQYFVLTLGEVFFSPTGLAFSYEQAPERMRSVVQAFWQLTVAFGNLITILLVANLTIFASVKYEFILFAALLAIDMLVFGILAYYYRKGTETKVKQEVPLQVI